MGKTQEIRRCSRCSLPSNFRNIKFDKSGICNFCRNHDKYIENFRRFSLAENNFLAQVEANRGKYQYDCVAGLSGGKDSSYVMYKLVRDYNLKVLAVTFDNGFLNKVAWDYINIIVNDLKLDHVVLSYEKDLHYQLYKVAGIHLGWHCIACSVLGLAITQKYCFDHKIPLMVHGRARNQMLRELSKYSPDAYLPYYGLNYRPFNFAEHLQAMKSTRKSLDRMMKMLIKDTKVREEFKRRYFIDPAECERQQFVPQLWAYFLMEDYDEPAIIDFMEKQVLKDAGKKLQIYHHYDCLAHPAFMYYYKQAFGWSLLELEIAFDVRDGKISRDRALELIHNEKEVKKIPEEAFDSICSKMHIERAELLDGLGTARRNIKMFKKLLKVKNFFKAEPFKF